MCSALAPPRCAVTARRNWREFTAAVACTPHRRRSRHSARWPATDSGRPPATLRCGNRDGPGHQRPATLAITALAATAVTGLAALSAVLALVAAHETCSGAAGPAPSDATKRAVPARYLRLYMLAARGSDVPWTVLAAIGSIETDHGRSPLPACAQGVNRYGCCAGPMQFNLARRTTLHLGTLRRRRQRRRHPNIYDPADAIPSAATYLCALLRRAHGNLTRRSSATTTPPPTSTTSSRAPARTRATPTNTSPSPPEARAQTATSTSPAGPANLRDAERVSSPRASARCRPGRWPAPRRRARSTPASTTTPSGSCAATTCASAPPAKPATTPTATAPPLDLVPADGNTQAVWDPSAGALAHDLGWTPGLRAPPAVAPPAISCPRSSSSATTATPATAHRGPAPAAAPPICTSPGSRRVTAPAASPALRMGHGVRRACRPTTRPPPVQDPRNRRRPPTPAPRRSRRWPSPLGDELWPPHWQVQVRARSVWLVVRRPSRWAATPRCCR